MSLLSDGGTGGGEESGGCIENELARAKEESVQMDRLSKVLASIGISVLIVATTIIGTHIYFKYYRAPTIELRRISP